MDGAFSTACRRHICTARLSDGFIYTPFYSQLVVKALNTFVPVEVNGGSKSQEMAALSEYEELEHGSNLWIARQAYLKLMEQSMQNQNAQDLPTLQARYKALQKIIIEEQEKEENDKDDQPVIPLLVPSVDKRTGTRTASLRFG